MVKIIDISEKYVTYIFKVEEWAKQETNMKQVASRATNGGGMFFWNVGYWLLLSLFFDSEDRSDMFLQNVG
jgi:hypothetical protein